MLENIRPPYLYKCTYINVNDINNTYDTYDNDNDNDEPKYKEITSSLYDVKCGYDNT